MTLRFSFEEMILRTDLDVTNSRLLVHQLVRTLLLVIGSQVG